MTCHAGFIRCDRSRIPDDRAEAAGFVELSISLAAALKVADLPHHHRDPFDRLLVAQAMTEPAVFYTADAHLRRYSELVVGVQP